MTPKILVVDDEPSIRHLLRQMLVGEHYQVKTAATVMEALARLEATSFDLVIVDLLLPELTGLDLAEAIRMLDPQTPVILITAYGAPSLEYVAAHPAISYYLHKPFSMERLLDLVHQTTSA